MNYDEFKELCRKSWEEYYNYHYIDRSKKRDQGKYCICNESKKMYIEHHLRRNLDYYRKLYLYNYTTIHIRIGVIIKF